MNIWECLYNDYSNGDTFLSPRGSQSARHDIELFVDKFEPTPKQKEELQGLLSEYYFDIERQGFLAGLRIALRLYSE